MDLKDKKKPVKWYLESTSDPTNKWAFPIDSVPFIIGRDEGCSLTLNSMGVSRRHTQLNISGDMLWIRDSGSTNGTYLNGRQITESELLADGDIIHIGQVGFCVLDRKDGQPDDGDPKTEFLNIADLRSNQLDSYATQLKKLIHDRAVVPHFQPILMLSDQHIKGYEILGRLSSDIDLPSDPADLFDIAVSLDMETELSSLFREEGVIEGLKLPDSTTLFINTHPIELNKIMNLTRSLKKVRERAASTNIVLEINEKAITNLKRMQSLQSALKSLDIVLFHLDNLSNDQ